MAPFSLALKSIFRGKPSRSSELKIAVNPLRYEQRSCQRELNHFPCSERGSNNAFSPEAKCTERETLVAVWTWWTWAEVSWRVTAADTNILISAARYDQEKHIAINLEHVVVAMIHDWWERSTSASEFIFLLKDIIKSCRCDKRVTTCCDNIWNNCEALIKI